uniref:Uncharacterized protein n=1 Tax=Anopheles funestus TaxID=62324 RepID=A0A182RLB4_ANOFN
MADVNVDAAGISNHHPVTPNLDLVKVSDQLVILKRRQEAVRRRVELEMELKFAREEEKLLSLEMGSSVTLMDEELAQQLGIEGVAEPLCMRWTGDTTRVEAGSRRVNLQVGPVGSSRRFFKGLHWSLQNIVKCGKNNTNSNEERRITMCDVVI